jgi:hypothetical protein
METKNRNDVQAEAIESLLKKRRSGVAVSMGVGKTLIGLKHMDGISPVKVLVVAPKKSIFQSWKDEMTKHKLEHLEPIVTFSTYISLPKQALDYDVVYLDECHNILPSHEPWLDKFKGMIIGQQNGSNNNFRLDTTYPSPGKIDTGNVLCHTMALETNKWSKGSSGPRDFTFWNNCFKLFKRQNTILLKEVISNYNTLR